MRINGQRSTEGNIADANPGYAWYLAVGKRTPAGFMVDEFVRCNRGGNAAVRRSIRRHGDGAAVYYRPTGARMTAQAWLGRMELAAALPTLNPTATEQQHATAAARIVADMDGGVNKELA